MIVVGRPREVHIGTSPVIVAEQIVIYVYRVSHVEQDATGESGV